jgi:hypothetical protein
MSTRTTSSRRRLCVGAIPASAGAVAAVAMLLLPSRSRADVTWVERTPPSSPSVRGGHAMAYDSIRRVAVLFGGRAPCCDGPDLGFLGDTWEWDGTTWIRQTPATSPPERANHALAFDASRGRVVLFGGENASGALDDTWEWDGSTWRRLLPRTAPDARSLHALAFHSQTGRTVLFGGWDRTSYLDDTWEWDGSEWAPRASPESPAPRARHALSEDSWRARLVLTGGTPAAEPLDTWEWDGIGWIRANPETSPDSRVDHTTVFDVERGRTILFGGLLACEQVVCIGHLDDTWEWDGVRWQAASPPSRPCARERHAMAYDASRGRVVLFGGRRGGTVLGDTWVLVAATAVSSVSPAYGCEQGGTLVRIRGAGLGRSPAETRVRFGVSEAAVVDVSPGLVVARTPAGFGTVDVTVETEDGAAVLAAGFTYLEPWLLARHGSVNAAAGDLENVLFVNASAGDPIGREVTLRAGQAIAVAITPPSSRAQSRFVAYVWRGEPGAATLYTLERGVGSLVMPPPFAPGAHEPVATFNNLGYRRALGQPTRPSHPAPSLLASRPTGVSRPAVVAIQGVIEDGGSAAPEGLSATNAIVVRIGP